jgi:chaperonin GroES
MIARPIGDRVIVKRLEAEDEMQNGIVIPGMAIEKPQEGIIVAAGRGHVENGIRVPLDVEVGEKIYFGKYSGTELKIQGEIYLVLREEEIMAAHPREE